MARMALLYGDKAVGVDVPEAELIGVLEGRDAPAVDFEAEFDRAWRNPIGISDPSLRFKPGEKVVVVVTDHTRSTPTKRLFPLFWERIRSCVRSDDVTILVGKGTHRAPTEAELERMLGDLRRQFRVALHDCDGDVVEIGRSARGTPIQVNRLVAEADRVVTIGHIAMHYYAGYSGGRKNILPGAAGRRTIELNHAQLTDPRCEGCVHDTNPISEEMVEAARLARVEFIVDVVCDKKGSVARIVVGDPEAAHAAGRAFWDSLFQVRVGESADLVVVSAGGHPKDIDLYQAYKALYNAAKAVKDGGTILLVAACPDGVGNEVFTDWVMRCRRPDEVFDILQKEGFRLGGHKAVYLAKDLRRAEIHLLSSLNDDLVRRFFLHPASDPNAVVAQARERRGPGLRVLVMPHGGETVPVVSTPVGQAVR